MKFDQKLVGLFLQNFNEAYRSAKLLQSSYIRMKTLMPMTLEVFKNLTHEDMDMIDAFRVRFCDFQDTLGNKVFRSILIMEEEAIGSSIDILNMMEKRLIIDSFDSFKKVRNIRNAFSHDYPESDDGKIELLNNAYEHTYILFKILNKIIEYNNKKLNLSMPNFIKLEI